MPKDYDSQEVPSLIKTDTIRSIDIPQLIELLAHSQEGREVLFTLTELNDREINLFSRAFILADYIEDKTGYEESTLKKWINKQLLMKISRKRRGRDEIVNALQTSPYVQRLLKSMEGDTGSRPRRPMP